jgi:hypothetical protein
MAGQVHMPKETFHLDAAIHQYMKKLDNKRLISRHCLNEIEEHLRDEIEDLMAVYDLPEAFHIACANFGPSDKILNEYGTLFRQKRLAQIKNVLSYYFDGRFIMRIFTGVLLGFLFIFGGMAIEGGNAHSVIQLTSFLITIGGAFAGLIIAYPVQIVFRSLSLAVTGRPAIKAFYIDASRVFKSFGDFSVLSGITGVIIGVIQVTQNLSHPEQIGPGIYVGLVCVFYTVMLKLFVCNPMHDSFIAKAYPSHENTIISEGRTTHNAA